MVPLVDSIKENKNKDSKLIQFFKIVFKKWYSISSMDINPNNLPNVIILIS